MKSRSLCAIAFLICLLVPFSESDGQVVLLQNDFGPAVDIGPTFQQLDNFDKGTPTPGSFDPATGQILTGGNYACAAGTNTPSSVDASGFSGFTITWEVENASIQNEINFNGWFFGITSGVNATGQDRINLFNQGPLAVGVVLQDNSQSLNSFSLREDPENSPVSTGVVEQQLFAPGDVPSGLAQFEDGFVLAMTIRHDNSVTVTSSGLAIFDSAGNTILPEINFSSSLQLFDYEDFSNDLVANTSIQQGSGELLVNLGSVSIVSLEPTLGDVNRDGVVDFLDISPFISLLSLGEFQDEADIDRNGLVNFFDISPLVGVLSGQ